MNLNFNRAPLEMVLNYLSDAAGFIIVQDTRVSGSATVTVNGKHMTRDEAVDLLNSVLNKNGYAAIRDGRTLTIVDKNDAKTREIPVKSGNIPETDSEERGDCDADHPDPFRRGAATGVGFVVVCFAAGHGGGERGGQFHCHHRHAGEHPAHGGNHPGD